MELEIYDLTGMKLTCIENELKALTNKIVGGYEDTAQEQNCRGDSVVHTEHHIVYDSFVDEVADLDEARHRGHHTKHRHLVLILLSENKNNILYGQQSRE